MNDPHARGILNGAATNLGWEIEDLLEVAKRKDESIREADIYER
jgi:hypothetical protein